MLNLIGVTGKKGCGKTTVGDYLVSKHSFTKISFADPLKLMLLSLGLSTEELWGNKKEVTSDLLGGQTPRHAMQTLGTEWGRQLIHKDIWIYAWRNRVAICSRPVVVDDLRFLNEAEIIKELGGKIILIERSESEQRDLHISEVEQEKICYDKKIVNDGSVDDLRLRITTLIRALRDNVIEKHKDILDLPAKDWEPKLQRKKAHDGISKLKI